MSTSSNQAEQFFFTGSYLPLVPHPLLPPLPQQLLRLPPYPPPPRPYLPRCSPRPGSSDSLKHHHRFHHDHQQHHHQRQQNQHQHHHGHRLLRHFCISYLLFTYSNMYLYHRVPCICRKTCNFVTPLNS